MNRLNKIKNMFLDLLFPDDTIKAEVADAINGLSLFNALRIAESLPIKDGYALFDYSDKCVKNLILRLKLKGDNKITMAFAQVLADVLIEDIAERAFIGTSQKPLFISVPMTKKTLKRRGFNQLELIVREVIKLVPTDTANTLKREPLMEFRSNLVKKTRDTIPQKNMKTRDEREKNLLNCFEVIKPDVINSRDIVILDDVYTTGSTMAELTKTLKNAGANNIYVYVLAYQPPKL